MAVWSKALPLTASCLSTLSGFEFHPEKVTSVLGLHVGVGLHWVLLIEVPFATFLVKVLLKYFFTQFIFFFL